jgi:hypothetical protein
MADSTFDAQFLNIPIRALSINGITYPVVTREATIVRGINRHDTIELSVLLAGTVTFDGKVRIPLDAAQPSSGTQDVDIETLERQPISFIYGVSPQTEQFVGYVTAVTPGEKFKEGLNFTITLTGSSVVLQRVIRRFETQVTVPQAIARRVDEQWLGYSGDSHTYQWPALAQTNTTDWEMIVKLAIDIGYVVFTWGGVVRVQDPVKLFKLYPYTTLTVSDDLLETDRKLMDFKPTKVSTDVLDKQGLEVFYFDPDGRVASIKQELTASRPVWMPYSENPVTNQEEAQVLVNAAKASLLRWPQQAKARIRGDAAIYPGLVVDVVPATNNSDFIGRWLVILVTHSMNRQAFQTELTLIRPDVVPMYDNSSFQHFWDRSGLGRPVMYLRDQQWFSSLSNPSARMLAS